MLHPTNTSYISNPYETFRQLRKDQPVFFSKDLDMWVISRYEDAKAVLTDSATFSNLLSVAPMFPVCEQAQKALSRQPMCPVVATSDPPEHTRFRKAVGKAFPNTLQQVKKYEPLIQQIVDELIQKNFTQNQVDVVRSFSWELPVSVILSILGVPRKDFDLIKKWSDGLVNMIWGHPNDQKQVQLAEGMANFIEYCHDLVQQKLSQPGDDFISSLIKYRNGDDSVLTLEEIGITAVNFLTAGHETTSNLISNAIYQLLRTDQWNQLSKNPEMVPQAIEEVLRFDSPIVGWLRYILKEATVGGKVIPAHQRVIVLIGSANRDELQFTDPEDFIIQRQDAEQHISFSAGRHYCIGSSLARLETEIALRNLLTRYPNMQLETHFVPSYLPNMAFRSLEKLPVVLEM